MCIVYKQKVIDNSWYCENQHLCYLGSFVLNNNGTSMTFLITALTVLNSSHQLCCELNY